MALSNKTAAMKSKIEKSLHLPSMVSSTVEDDQKKTEASTAARTNHMYEKTKVRRDVREIPIDLLKPNPDQPRTFFDPDELELMAETMVRVGVLSPLLVESKEGDFQIIAGERRWRAAKIAQLKTVPCLLKDASQLCDSDELAFIDNCHRSDLHPIEESVALLKMTDKGYSNNELCVMIGKHKSYISQAMRIAEFANLYMGKYGSVNNLIEVRTSGGERLVRSHYIQIAYANNFEAGLEILDAIVTKGMSVSTVRQETRKVKTRSDFLTRKDIVKSFKRFDQTMQSFETKQLPPDEKNKTRIIQAIDTGIDSLTKNIDMLKRKKSEFERS